ncbi:MAG: VWA domain-containing protein [Planctomycetes bacterium]|nr:VWA domain-containing protein [Planctomycetota bacterium]
MIASLQQAVDTGLRESFKLADVPAAWIVVLVLAPLAFVVCVLGYRGESISFGGKLLLGTLRFLALALLCLVIFRPVRVERREEVQKAEVVVLLDDSASMLRKDSYAANEPLRQAAARFSKKEGEATRSEVAIGLVQDALAPALANRGYVPRVYTFADTVAAQGATIASTARGSSTRIGDALSQVLAAYRGHHLTDVVIVSDGRQTSGSPALDAARAAQGAGVQVHAITIGDTRAEKNVKVELVEVPSAAFEGDEIAAVVRVVARGVPAGARGHVTLEELTGDEGRRVVAEDDAELGEGGARRTLIARPGPADPRTHERRFRVSIPTEDGETLVDDNAVEFSVHVTPEKIRVLYIDGYSRYEWRYLKEILRRADQNIVMQSVLLSGDAGWIQPSTKGVAALSEVPTDRKTLLDQYDVILLGDFSPYAISPDPQKCDEFLRTLREFVERGGGLGFIAGEYDNPRAFLNTPLEDVLPVTIEAAELAGFQGDASVEFRPVLEDPLNPHEIVRLLPDVEANRKLWEDVGGLEGQYWYRPVTRAKPGAQVLLRHPRDGARGERYPLLVAGYFPAGRVLFSALDSTWRWRLFHIGEHDKFWRNAVRWLSLGRLKSGDRRYRIEVARSTYNLGERVGIEARVLDEDYRPSLESDQKIRVGDPDGKVGDLELSAVTGKPGTYRGSYDAERLGLYRVWFERDSGRIASTEFEVTLPSLENQDPTPDPSLLAELATVSGGKHVDLAHVDDLLADFRGGEERREPISARLDDVWDRWSTLLAALFVFALEWVLRKRYDLV